MKKNLHTKAMTMALAKVAVIIPQKIIVKDILYGICVDCNKEVRRFSNREALKEFKVSGLCQPCQILAFGE